MVIKFDQEPDDVFFIEATSNRGVIIKSYRGMKWAIGNFYDKVVLRHLEWQRNEMSLSILDQFLKEVQGRKYNLTFDLLRRKKTISEAGQSQFEMAAAKINNSAA